MARFETGWGMASKLGWVDSFETSWVGTGQLIRRYETSWVDTGQLIPTYVLIVQTVAYLVYKGYHAVSK